jgi:hypothetical protein
MRAFVARLTAAAILSVAACTPTTSATEGNLVIRCPSSEGAIAADNGQPVIDGVSMQVTADLKAAPSAETGMTFDVEVQLPDPGTHPAPNVDCVRLEKPDRGERWDATPFMTHQFFGGPMARIVASGDHGPHWMSGDSVAVTVWLTVSSRRYPIALGRRLVHP